MLLTTIFSYIKKAYKQWAMYRRTRYELGVLSNRDLADLGISRSDIDFIARNASKGLGR